MTTGEFIKMLQKEDPSGETHMRFPGGEPWFIESKAGFWDGAYSYFDEGNNYVHTTRGSKIDVYIKGLDEWIEELIGSSIDMPFEEISKKMIFEYTSGNKEANQQLIDSRLREAKRIYDEIIELNKKYLKDEKI